MQVTVTHEELCERFAAEFPLQYKIALQTATIEKVTQGAGHLEEQNQALSKRNQELEAELLELSGKDAKGAKSKVTRLPDPSADAKAAHPSSEPPTAE